MSNLVGILSISNASGLKYPYLAVVKNLSQLCTNVVVGLDPTYSVDLAEILALKLDNVVMVDSVWNRDNRAAGSEIALQMDKMIDYAQKMFSPDWVVVMQADEVLHEDAFDSLRASLDFCSPDITGLSTERIYFWRDLKTVRTDWNADLVRIFRPGYYSFMAENTDKAGMYSAQVKEGIQMKSPFLIYHYSRVDDPNVISQRVRNLDTLFHPESSLTPVDQLPAYDFLPRAYDNYSMVESPPKVEGIFAEFFGTHPKVMLDFYGEK